MSVLTPNQACHNLADALSQLAPTTWATDCDFKQLIQHLRRAAESPSNPKTGLVPAIQELSRYLGQQLIITDTGDSDAIFTFLANTTRDVPFWRPLFGLDSKASAEENRLRKDPRVSADCVLEVAQRIVNRSPSSFSRVKTRAALRLIANCCADNNINRSVIVHRDGIGGLMHLACLRLECDLVIPTLYNVCVDYDEPAIDVQGKPWPALKQTNETSQASAGPIVNAAEQKLGSWWNQEEYVSSVEYLVRTSGVSDPSSLADVLEMASRVSVYGIQNLACGLDGTEADDEVAAYLTEMVYELITKGTEIALSDSESWIGILQSILNVLSQKNVHGAVLKIEGTLWQLVNLPYLHPTDDDPELEASIAPYRKAILKLVYEISSLESYGNTFNADFALVKNCVMTLEQFQGTQRPAPGSSPSSSTDSPYASVMVLLANSIVTPDRPEQLLKSYPHLVHSLSRIVASSKDPELVRPTIDLATRLALCPSGQGQLYSFQFLAATKLRLTPTSETDTANIEIQRNIVDLARLIVKGNAAHLDTLAQSSSTKEASFMSAIMHLFHHTPDTSTKLAISRLTIEILRTLMSWTSNTTTPASTLDPDADKLKATNGPEKTLESIFSSSHSQTPAITPAEMIGYIITQSTSGSQDPTPMQPLSSTPNPNPEPEGWFGLALLSTFPSYHTTILDTLSANDSLLMERLRDIVTENVNSVTASGQQPSSSSSTLTTTQERQRDHQTSQRNPSQPLQDPRLANIKVLVVRMVQNSASAPTQPPTSSSSIVSSATLHDQASQTVRMDKTWQELESVAAVLGVDWVIV